jgi:hypothetical protein
MVQDLLEYSNLDSIRQDFYKFSLNLLIHRMTTRRETQGWRSKIWGCKQRPIKPKFLNKFSQTRLYNTENHHIIRTSPIIYLKSKAFYGIIVTKSGGKGTKLRRLAIGGAT